MLFPNPIHLRIKRKSGIFHVWLKPIDNTNESKYSISVSGPNKDAPVFTSKRYKLFASTIVFNVKRMYTIISAAIEEYNLLEFEVRRAAEQLKQLHISCERNMIIDLETQQTVYEP